MLVALPTARNWGQRQPFRTCFYTYDIYGLLCYISINRSFPVLVLSHFIVTQLSRRLAQHIFSGFLYHKKKISATKPWHHFHGNLSAQRTTGATAQLNLYLYRNIFIELLLDFSGLLIFGGFLGISTGWCFSIATREQSSCDPTDSPSFQQSMLRGDLRIC
jgi:hypothetical protein